MRERGAVRFKLGTRIPMRDGVELSATEYAPKNQVEKLPSVVNITPYNSDIHHNRGMYFASHGVPFVIVDARGRGDSDGQFHPRAHVQVGKDGYDVIEWLADRPYCNGRVGMWGASYAAYAQWATAREFPPHLSTIVPTASPFLGIDTPMQGNIFGWGIEWLVLTFGRSAKRSIYDDTGMWRNLYREWLESGRAFSDVDLMSGTRMDVFQEWLGHPRLDDYWDRLNPESSEYERMQIPILTITGIYDADQLGALEHYRRHVGNSSLDVGKRHYLVIGPWDHAGTGAPRREFGGLSVGEGSLIDLNELHAQWYAWSMRDGPMPAFLKGKVTYYVMGADVWRHADTLRDVTADYETLYLDSTQNANDVFTSGTLGKSSGRGAADWYVYDPRQADGPETDAETQRPCDSLVDQGVTFALQGRQLVYHTAPFVEPTEISGFFKLSAWISIDCPDTDLYVSIHEVGPDGSSVELTTDAIRARYRVGLRTERLIMTTDPLRYDFERFTFVAREIKRGSRLRLIVAPRGRLGCWPFWEKNYNGGGIVAAETAREGRSVTVRLYHHGVHQSVLHIPLGRPENHQRK